MAKDTGIEPKAEDVPLTVEDVTRVFGLSPEVRAAAEVLTRPIKATVPVSDDLAKYLEDNLTAYEQVISKAMALQVIHGWPMKQAVAEAMKEVTE